MTKALKLNRAELVRKIAEIIRDNTNDPAEELRVMGKVMLEIGEALDGLSGPDARAVIRSASIASGIE